MTDFHSSQQPDLLEQIPDPETVRSWLAAAIRRSELLRFLLRLAIRKAAFKRPASEQVKGVSVVR